MKGLIFLVFLILIAGCAHRGFMKDGATEQEFYSDLQECMDNTAPEWSACAGGGCMQQSRDIQYRRNVCMQAKGWTITRESGRFMP